jgi:tRNA(fMet)-specific endonuclease VapC
LTEAPLAAAGPEHVICDTSFVTILEVSASRPTVTAHWLQPVRDRLDAAILSIPVFVLGEVRSGHRLANWGAARIENAERALAAYLVVPLDYDVLDSYVDLRARYFKQLGDNDMWIAATARARGWPLVTCDLDFCRVRDELDLIYLPAKPDSAAECPPPV